jgi:hypothetical protein
MVHYEIYLTDEKITYDESEQYFLDADLWAQTNCPSFVSCSIQDVSDVSYVCDNIALYLFKEEKDAMFFKLKWS